MTTDYQKPLPDITEETRPFWDGLRQRTLRLQQCGNCDHVRYPVALWCPRCLDETSSWIAMSGRGEVVSTIVFHQVYHPAFADDVPYNVSLIRLDEGPTLFSNVIGRPPSEVEVGDRVEIVYDDVTAEVTIPRFRASSAPTHGAQT